MKNETAERTIRGFQRVEGINLAAVLEALEANERTQASNILNGICQHEGRHLPALQEFAHRFRHELALSHA